MATPLSFLGAAKILQVSVSCPLEEARQSYRNLLLKSHPDKGGNTDYFRDVRAAWQVWSRHANTRRRHSDTVTQRPRPTERKTTAQQKARTATEPASRFNQTFS